MPSSLSLTHVIYDESSLISLGMAYITLAPLALMICFVPLLLFERGLKFRNTFIFFVGQLLNRVLNTLLKKIFKEERPLLDGSARKDYGWPSDHGQFMAFFTIAFWWWLSQRREVERPLRVLLQVGVVVGTVLVSWSRIYLGYHDWWQVGGGLVVGTLGGYLFVAVARRLVAKRS
ncbi:putative pap2 domain protein [Paratrimastix pyriformis]|uniref:Pap2 domain protein n=1 Tax=Paratrimastix pyriformis TaxID=342808 RepID=A0ABQ8UWW1_9EUKA|nr:putative pap2 domain protein [Paratrimastix pyriformis]